MPFQSPPTNSKDPLFVLTVNPFCEQPDVESLSLEQQCALHEFFHAVLVAGYRLYQTVPPDKARVIIQKKFAKAAEELMQR